MACAQHDELVVEMPTFQRLPHRSASRHPGPSSSSTTPDPVCTRALANNRVGICGSPENPLVRGLKLTLMRPLGLCGPLRAAVSGASSLPISHAGHHFTDFA